MRTLLFIDDDQDFLESNRLYFSHKGYQVFCCRSPKESMDMLSSAAVDCIILDIDMPDINGFELCQRIREQSCTPLIFLSGLSESENRIRSFRVGGDDFLGKPYDIVELEYRILARIRRSEDVFPDEVITFGDLKIDTGRRIVTYAGTEGDFSALQFDLLAFLARNPNKVFSYEQLYDRIWKTPIVASRHNLQVAVATIRQKLNRLCGGRQYIRTVSRKGYCFVPEETHLQRSGAAPDENFS